MNSKYIKYIILSTVLCIVTISSTTKAGNASPKDSLLSIADTINDRGAKVDFLIASCKKNLNEDWTLLLIDYAMTESEALKDTIW